VAGIGATPQRDHAMAIGDGRPVGLAAAAFARCRTPRRRPAARWRSRTPRLRP